WPCARVLCKLLPGRPPTDNPLAAPLLRTRTVRLLLCTFPAPNRRVRKSSEPHRGWDQGESRREIPSPHRDNFEPWRALLRAMHELPQVSATIALPCGWPNLQLPDSHG